jgi:hypothetical protein
MSLVSSSREKKSVSQIHPAKCPLVTILKWLLLAIEVDARRYQHKGDVRGTHLTRKNDKMPLVDRFTALANITSTNLDDHAIMSLNFTRFILSFTTRLSLVLNIHVNTRNQYIIVVSSRAPLLQ